MRKLLLAILVFFIIPAFVFADEITEDEFVYLFHLYYDNGQLFADRDFEFSYDVLPEEFVPETVNAQYPFRGEVITFSNQVSATFIFDPRRGDPGFLQGKISVKAPYIPNGQKVVFYDAQGGPILSIIISGSSFCNEDGVCNVDRGEDDLSCPSDCRGVTPLPPATGGDNGGGQNGMLMAVIYVLIIAGAGLGGWYGWKKWKSRQEPPPTVPTMQFPQNPNVQ